MKERIKYFNWGQAIFNVVLIGAVIYMIIAQTDRSYSLFWTASMLLIVSNIWFISTWSNKGKELDVDKNKSRELMRSFNDITVIIIVFYCSVFAIVQVVDVFNNGFMYNLYLALGFYVLTWIFQLFAFLAVDNAIRETRKVIAKNYDNKK